MRILFIVFATGHFDYLVFSKMAIASTLPEPHHRKRYYYSR